MNQIYETNQEISMVFSENYIDQADAQAYLHAHQLDRVSRMTLENRWNTQWSTSWGIEQGGDIRRRSLFQW